MTDAVNNQQSKISDGFKALVAGYGKYATEVAINRAFPAIDGLKPVHRRILYTMHKYKINDLSKSANVCGKVLELHPHGDQAVYATAILMTDSSEYQQFPYLHGKGNFSKVYFSEKDSQAAAPRYTEMCLSANAKSTLFNEMDGVSYQFTEDGSATEPVLLPVNFPSILCTAQMGIAVGIACNNPSFNFNEVLDLTIEYLQTGKITRVIAPDFNTGGEYVLNNNALRSIMLTGKGSIKLRGAWQIEGKEILITQIPYYSRISDILTKARAMQGVANANDETDLAGMKIRITCTSKQVVNHVVLELLRDTGLQVNSGINLAVVDDGEPKFEGVIGIIDRWCKFRRKVLKKQYELDLKNIRNEMRAPKALIQLISNKELKEKFLDALKISAAEATKVLKAGIPGIERDVIDYILDLKIRHFADCEGRKKQYDNLCKREKALEESLSDLDGEIIKQLKVLNKTYQIPRKTKIVTNDYSFDSINEERLAAKQVAVYGVNVIVDDMYIKKIRFYTGDASKAISCKSNDIIVCLDNKGRVLRIPLADVPDCSADAIGAYIPKILNIPADFKVIDSYKLDNKKVDYLYTDGYVATLDLSEWCDKKRLTRVTENGLATAHIDKIFAVVDKTKAYMLVVTSKNKVGIFKTDFENTKSRASRMKLVGLDKDELIKAVFPLSNLEAPLLITGDSSKYYDKCHYLTEANQLNPTLWAEIRKR